MKDVVATCDFYEACYYLSCQFSIETVNAFRVNKKIKCEFHFAGEDLYSFRNLFMKGEAVVNLVTFRSSHHTLTTLIKNAQKVLVNEEKGGQK